QNYGNFASLPFRAVIIVFLHCFHLVQNDMIKFFTALFCCSFYAAGATAQITFTADDFIQGLASNKQNNQSFTASATSGLGKLMKASGAGITWDFSTIPFTPNAPPSGTSTLLSSLSEAALADDPDFATATHVVKFVTQNPTDGIQYVFYKIDQNGYSVCGTTRDSMGLKTKLQSYTPPLLQYKFPLTYNTAWQNSCTVKTPYYPAGYVVTIVDTVTIDGYGSLVTPTSARGKGGASPMATNDVLRESHKTIHVTVFNGDTISSVTYYSFNWTTKGDHSATILADELQKPTGGYYSAPGTGTSVPTAISAGDLFDLKLSANPAMNSETKLFYTMKSGGNSQVSLMDLLGHEVQMLHNGYASQGQNIISIETAKLSPGTYFIHLNSDGLQATRKLLVSQ
ncbi:MAG: T9SS type A sorting domain-containing protein, partial [Ignavibacteriota bacterium]